MLCFHMVWASRRWKMLCFYFFTFRSLKMVESRIISAIFNDSKVFFPPFWVLGHYQLGFPQKESICNSLQ